MDPDLNTDPNLAINQALAQQILLPSDPNTNPLLSSNDEKFLTCAATMGKV